jgi:MoxR-like ATPase
MPAQIDIEEKLALAGYVVDPALGMAVGLSLDMSRPLLLEGEAGVGKTEVAVSLAKALGTRLIRLQCYEGLDVSSAIYEWNYQRQILAIKASEKFAANASDLEAQLFTNQYLLERPLLAAIRQEISPVLLIDEIDRADEEFEAFLLEVLADFQITIPELGTIKAISVPHVILTSNQTRELSDALRRRCLYAYVDFPDVMREMAILRARMPGLDEEFAGQIARFVHELRLQDLKKRPGIAETLDWCAALTGLGVRELTGAPEMVHQTLLCLLKTQEDSKKLTPELTAEIVAGTA